jgi:hypothetical protein
MSASASGMTVPQGQHPPYATITPDDHSAWVIISCALGLALTFLFAAIRVFVRTTINGEFGMDDYLVAAGTVCFTIPSHMDTFLSLTRTAASFSAIHRRVERFCGRPRASKQPTEYRWLESGAESTYEHGLSGFGNSLTDIAVIICEQLTLRATSNPFESGNDSLSLKAHACKITSAVSEWAVMRHCGLGCRIRDRDRVVL